MANAFVPNLAQRRGLCITNRLPVFLVFMFGQLTNPANSSLVEISLNFILELSNCLMI